jgi:hypothetical protein
VNAKQTIKNTKTKKDGQGKRGRANTKTKKDGQGKRGRASEAAQLITSFLDALTTDPGNTGVAAPSNNVA